MSGWRTTHRVLGTGAEIAVNHRRSVQGRAALGAAPAPDELVAGVAQRVGLDASPSSPTPPDRTASKTRAGGRSAAATDDQPWREARLTNWTSPSWRRMLAGRCRKPTPGSRAAPSRPQCGRNHLAGRRPRRRDRVPGLIHGAQDLARLWEPRVDPPLTDGGALRRARRHLRLSEKRPSRTSGRRVT